MAAINLQYLFVVEVVITRAGVDRHAFDEVLANHYVLYDRSLEVDRPLETALLASRFLEEVVSAAPNDPSTLAKNGLRQQSEVELVYVVATSRQIEEAAADFLARREEFAAIKFNLAVKPGDVRVFEQLRRASSDQFVQAGRPDRLADERDPAVAAAAEKLGRARRLIMQVTLLSRSARSLGAAGLLSHSDPRSVPPPSLRDRSSRSPMSGRSPLGVKPPPTESDVQYEVLFVLHTQPDREAEKGPAPRH